MGYSQKVFSQEDDATSPLHLFDGDAVSWSLIAGIDTFIGRIVLEISENPLSPPSYVKVYETTGTLSSPITGTTTGSYANSTGKAVHVRMRCDLFDVTGDPITATVTELFEVVKDAKLHKGEIIGHGKEVYAQFRENGFYSGANAELDIYCKNLIASGTVGSGGGTGLIADTVAALRALNASFEGVALLGGYYADGDGGGGLLYYDASDTTSLDNGFTVFVTNNGGRVKRVGHRFTFQQGGAIPTNDPENQADQTAIVQNIVDVWGEGGIHIEPGKLDADNIFHRCDSPIELLASPYLGDSNYPKIPPTGDFVPSTWVWSPATASDAAIKVVINEWGLATNNAEISPRAYKQRTNSLLSWADGNPYDFPLIFREDDSAQEWMSKATVAITGVTQAAEAVVTVASHTFVDGDIVYITGVVGMTELNTNHYRISDSTPTTFKLKSQGRFVYVDSTGFGAWSSGGTILASYRFQEDENFCYRNTINNRWYWCTSNVTASTTTIPPTTLPNWPTVGTFVTPGATTEGADPRFPAEVTHGGIQYTVWGSYRNGDQRDYRDILRGGPSSQKGGTYTNRNTIIPSVAITDVTQALPPVVTSAAHGLTNGCLVRITGVAGMTELNGNLYAIKNVAANTFELTTHLRAAVDSSGYGAYVSGGTAQCAPMPDVGIWIQTLTSNSTPFKPVSDGFCIAVKAHPEKQFGDNFTDGIGWSRCEMCNIQGAKFGLALLDNQVTGEAGWVNQGFWYGNRNVAGVEGNTPTSQQLPRDVSVYGVYVDSWGQDFGYAPTHNVIERWNTETISRTNGAEVFNVVLRSGRDMYGDFHADVYTWYIDGTNVYHATHNPNGWLHGNGSLLVLPHRDRGSIARENKFWSSRIGRIEADGLNVVECESAPYTESVISKEIDLTKGMYISGWDNATPVSYGAYIQHEDCSFLDWYQSYGSRHALTGAGSIDSTFQAGGRCEYLPAGGWGFAHAQMPVVEVVLGSGIETDYSFDRMISGCTRIEITKHYAAGTDLDDIASWSRGRFMIKILENEDPAVVVDAARYPEPTGVTVHPHIIRTHNASEIIVTGSGDFQYASTGGDTSDSLTFTVPRWARRLIVGGYGHPMIGMTVKVYGNRHATIQSAGASYASGEKVVDYLPGCGIHRVPQVYRLSDAKSYILNRKTDTNGDIVPALYGDKIYTVFEEWRAGRNYKHGMWLVEGNNVAKVILDHTSAGPNLYSGGITIADPTNYEHIAADVEWASAYGNFWDEASEGAYNEKIKSISSSVVYADKYGTLNEAIDAAGSTSHIVVREEIYYTAAKTIGENQTLHIYEGVAVYPSAELEIRGKIIASPYSYWWTWGSPNQRINFNSSYYRGEIFAGWLGVLPKHEYYLNDAHLRKIADSFRTYGGRPLTFPAGRYLLGADSPNPIDIPSDTRLSFAPGTEIYAVATNNGRSDALFRTYEFAKNVEFCGSGSVVFDGGGYVRFGIRADRSRYGQDYYVDPVNGDNANSGDAPHRARKTLASAMSLIAAPIDTLHLAAGRPFNEELLITGKNGTAADPITIRSYDPEGLGRRAVISGAGLSLTRNAVISAKDCEYLIIRDIDIIDSPGGGIEFDQHVPTALPVFPSNLRSKVLNCTVDGCQTFGISAKFTNGIDIVGNVVKRAGMSAAGGGIVVNGCENFVVERNTVQSCMDVGIHVVGDCFTGNVSKNLIRECDSGILLNHARDTEVDYNFVHSCGMDPTSTDSGIKVGVGNGANTLRWDVSGLKDRDHASVAAAVLALTPIELTVTTTYSPRTTNNYIHHNFAGFCGYAGFASIPAAAAGSITANTFANNVAYHNGYGNGVSAGFGFVFEEPGGFSTVFAANKIQNNIAIDNSDTGFAPEWEQTISNNVSFSDVNGSVDTTLIQGWSYSAGNATALKTAIDNLSALHTEPEVLTEKSDGSLEVWRMRISDDLSVAGTAVSSLKVSGAAWPDIDDAGIGVTGQAIQGAGSPLEAYRGSIEYAGPSIKVSNGVAVASWAYYGSGMSATRATDVDDLSGAMAIASAGTVPALLYQTPYTDGKCAANPQAGKVYQHPVQAYGQPGTGDIIWELVFRHANNAADLAIVSTQTVDADTGFTILQKGGGANALSIVVNDSGGAATLNTSAYTDLKWHHAIIAFDRSVGLYAYIDGVAAGTQAAVQALTLDGGANKLTIFSRPGFTSKAVTGQALAFIAQYELAAGWFQSAEDIDAFAADRYEQITDRTPIENTNPYLDPIKVSGITFRNFVESGVSGDGVGGRFVLQSCLDSKAEIQLTRK